MCFFDGEVIEVIEVMDGGMMMRVRIPMRMGVGGGMVMWWWCGVHVGI